MPTGVQEEGVEVPPVDGEGQGSRTACGASNIVVAILWKIQSALTD